MTLRQAGGRPRPPRYPHSRAERRQVEHELAEAYKAAKKLEERLELAGLEAAPARLIRDELAARLVELGRPMPEFVP